MKKNTAKNKRPGSGRTKGSFSFVQIPLADLTSKFADLTTPIRVGRLWAESVGFAVAATTSAKNLDTTIVGQTSATAPVATVQEL